MAMAPSQANLIANDLLAALEKMEPAEAEKVVRYLHEKLAYRRVRDHSVREAELLQEIYREKRSGFQERFDALQSRRRAFLLTPEEQDELLQLVAESEAFTVRRLEALAELSRLRRVTLPGLMRQLGLKAPEVV